MARTTTPIRSSSRRAAEPAPKKRLGRPPGSKNRVPAKAAGTTRSTRKAAAPAAPRLNKAELEAQLVKLERTVARLRKQNAELKQAAKEAAVPAAPEPAPERKPRRIAAAPRTARARRSAAEAEPVSVEPDEDSEA